jgi:hypothetical protein
MGWQRFRLDSLAHRENQTLGPAAIPRRKGQDGIVCTAFGIRGSLSKGEDNSKLVASEIRIWHPGLLACPKPQTFVRHLTSLLPRVSSGQVRHACSQQFKHAANTILCTFPSLQLNAGWIRRDEEELL